MAKDPAFLFYPGDWLGGTMTFTRAQKGAYMDLLMAQFSQGFLTFDDIKLVLGTDFWMWESKLKYKFQEENGLYFNRKLQNEVIRRRLFTESRKGNLSKNPHMGTHMEPHMETGNENVNEKIKDKGVQGGKEKKGFTPPTLEQVQAYFAERKTSLNPVAFHAHYEANGWVQGNAKKPIKNWKACVTTWEEKQKEFTLQAPVQAAGKPQAEVVALQCVALKMDDWAIKVHMLEKGYTEHRIDEALMRARGNVK